MTKTEARKWVREHFAYYIEASDPPDDAAEEGNELIGEVWGDECRKIARKIRGKQK